MQAGHTPQRAGSPSCPTSQSLRARRSRTLPREIDRTPSRRPLERGSRGGSMDSKITQQFPALCARNSHATASGGSGSTILSTSVAISSSFFRDRTQQEVSSTPKPILHRLRLSTRLTSRIVWIVMAYCLLPTTSMAQTISSVFPRDISGGAPDATQSEAAAFAWRQFIAVNKWCYRLEFDAPKPLSLPAVTQPWAINPAKRQTTRSVTLPKLGVRTPILHHQSRRIQS